MLKRNGQPCGRSVTRLSGKLTEGELAVYQEAAALLEENLQPLTKIRDDLCELERNASVHVELSLAPGGRVEYLEMRDGHIARWQVRSCLFSLAHSKIFLCQRPAQTGTEFGVIQSFPESSAYAKARGICDLMFTGTDPTQLVSDYLRYERQTLQIAAGMVVARIGASMVEKYPEQKLTHVIRALAQSAKETMSEQSARKIPVQTFQEGQKIGVKISGGGYAV